MAGTPPDAASGTGAAAGVPGAIGRLEANKAVVRRWMHEVWSEGDLAALDDLIRPDYLLHGAADVRMPDVQRMGGLTRIN
jgi:hypothetical protein